MEGLFGSGMKWVHLSPGREARPLMMVHLADQIGSRGKQKGMMVHQGSTEVSWANRVNSATDEYLSKYWAMCVLGSHHSAIHQDPWQRLALAT